MLQKYYQLIKPGRTIANGMTTVAGFLLAADGHIRLGLLLAAVGGTCLIVASACAFNNYFDRGIDSDMQRTKSRVLVQGSISLWAAIAYATILGAIGFTILAVYTNLPTVIIGIVGMFDYLVLYGISKRRSVYSTLIGSICGATPIVAGYTAVTGRFDIGALLLFLIMVFWQMPHFYAIAIYRRDDYAAAHLPIWSVKKGIPATVNQMILFSAAFLVACVALSLTGHASRTFLAVMAVIAGMWFWKSLQGTKATDAAAWARRMFGFSLLVLMVLCGTLMLNAWLP